jgi:hypothetical protein
MKISEIHINPNNPRIELKEIFNYPSYMAGSDGLIYSKYSDKPLKSGSDYGGYQIVTLCENKKRFTKTVHRLIALAFYGDSDLPINHINGVKKDNRPVNIEYCTAKENTRHALKNGLLKPNTIEIAEKKRKPIMQIDLMSKVIIATYESTHQAARETKINRGNICNCARGVIYQAGNFNWEYL